MTDGCTSTGCCFLACRRARSAAAAILPLSITDASDAGKWVVVWECVKVRERIRKKKVRIQKKGEQRRINYLRRTGINILEIQYWNTVISYWRAPRIFIVLYLFTRGTTVVYCTGKYCSRTHCREKSLELYRTMDSTTIHNLIDTTTDRYEWESLLKMKDEWFGWKHKISLSQSEHDLIRYIVRKEKLIVPLSHWRE
jgi:hypothetical protein